ncbi:hypothetical protein HDU88_004501 [Geranomyces variabilis]|nr:hypothetical protein HDU88_004501 [Geranomyces variabilis]
MYAKSLITAALAMLASGVAASGVVLTNVDGSTQTPGTPFEIDWLFAPNDPAFPGISGTDVISFQLIDYRLGADKGQLVGTGPIAQAPLNAQKVSAILPPTAPGTQYRLAMTCNGKTVYSAGVFSVAGGDAGASSAAPAASGATPAATVAAPSGTPAAGTTPLPSSVVSIAQPTSSLVVVVPNGSKTTVAANPTGTVVPVSSSSAAAPAATDAAKNGAASSAPALIALAAPAVAVFFL